jgi:hypothetical protein
MKINDSRGDSDVITLSKGQKIAGRILGPGGKPWAGIYLSATRRGSESIIFRATTSDAEGNFTFAPLGPGDYIVEPQDVASDLTTENMHETLTVEKHPLPGFFSPQRVTLIDAADPTPIEFRAIAAVQLKGHFTVSKDVLDGMAHRSSEQRAAVARAAADFADAGRGNFGPPAAAAAVPAVSELLRRLAPALSGENNGFPSTPLATSTSKEISLSKFRAV